MDSRHFQEIDSELIDDFFYDFSDAHERCERTLLALEHSPTSSDLLDDLFRSVHTVKGNLIYIGLEDLTPLLQSLEDVLQELRDGRLQYDDLLSDLVLLCLDAIKALINEGLFNQHTDIDDAQFDACCRAISAITERHPSERKQAIHSALLVLDPNIEPQQPASNSDYSSPEPSFNRELSALGVEHHPDLDYFANLMPAVEARSHYWQGRTRRIIRSALQMNELAGRPVEPTQLTAAAYIHDLGMAFLPLSLLHHSTQLKAAELRQIQSHCRTGADLLRHIGGHERHWEEAEEMILQHHEHMDGSGYPKGLSENEICAGAKILAIADAFDAISHDRPGKTPLKRPLIRAVLEINRCAGVQFSQYWVDIFNRSAQKASTLH